MTTTTAWRELHRCDTRREARIVLLCICAMEFDVRLVDPVTREPIPTSDEVEEDNASVSAGQPSSSENEGPAAIEVAEGDWRDLKDVLAEIIAEQEEFDAMLEDRRQTSLRVRQSTIGVLAFIILVLALTGLIEL